MIEHFNVQLGKLSDYVKQEIYRRYRELSNKSARQLLEDLTRDNLELVDFLQQLGAHFDISALNDASRRSYEQRQQEQIEKARSALENDYHTKLESERENLFAEVCKKFGDLNKYKVLPLLSYELRFILQKRIQ